MSAGGWKKKKKKKKFSLWSVFFAKENKKPKKNFAPWRALRQQPGLSFVPLSLTNHPPLPSPPSPTHRLYSRLYDGVMVDGKPIPVHNVAEKENDDGEAALAALEFAF